MSYSKIDGKSIDVLEKELKDVWYSHYQPGEEYSDHIPFDVMVKQFAEDDFYNLHFVAIEYLNIKKGV